MFKMIKTLRMGTAAAVATGLMAASLLATAPASAKDLGTWHKEIAQMIADKQVYPRSALTRNIQGVAKVKVTFGRDGTVTTYEVLEETGESVLDREVPKLMERISPVPTPPSDAGEDQLTVVVPLAWVLQ